MSKHLTSGLLLATWRNSAVFATLLYAVGYPGKLLLFSLAALVPVLATAYLFTIPPYIPENVHHPQTGRRSPIRGVASNL